MDFDPPTTADLAHSMANQNERNLTMALAAIESLQKRVLSLEQTVALLVSERNAGPLHFR